MTANGTALRLLAGKMKQCFGAAEVLWVKSHKGEDCSHLTVFQEELQKGHAQKDQLRAAAGYVGCHFLCMLQSKL